MSLCLRQIRLLAVVLGLCFFTFIPISQAQGNISIEPWDIIFVVDQSGSMFGRAPQSNQALGNNRRATDLDNLRFEALRHSISWLGNFQAQQAERDIQVELNVSVIYFGDEAETVDVNPTDNDNIWTEFDYVSLDEWNQDRGDILNTVTINNYVNTFDVNLGNTNFLEALRQSISHFDALNVSNIDERIQTIVILTDGEPCAFREQGWTDNTCNYQPDKEDHMNRLEDYVSQNFGLSNQNVYVVAIDEQDDYWSRYEAAWQRIAEQAIRLEGFEKLSVTFNDILSSVANEEVIGSLSSNSLQLGIEVPLNQPFYVSPYQQEMVVTLFKSQDDIRLRVTSPDGPITSDSANVRVLGENSNIETWVVKHPLPGDWEFSARDADGRQDNDASLRMDLIRADFTTQIENIGNMYVPFNYSFSVRDKDGQPLPEYNSAISRGFDIRSQVEINHDGETLFNSNLNAEGRGDYNLSYTPLEDGAYSVNLSVTSGRNDEVTFSNATNPDVIEIRQMSVEVDGIPSAEQLWPEDIQQTVSVSLWDGETDMTDTFTIRNFTLNLIDGTSTTCEATPTQTVTQQSATVNLTIEEPSIYLICMSLLVDDPLSDNPNDVLTIANNQPVDAVARNVFNSTATVQKVNLLALEVVSPNSYQPNASDAQVINLSERANAPTMFNVPYWFGSFPYWAPDDATITLRIVDATTNQPVSLSNLLSPDELNTVFTTFHVFDRNNNNTDLAADGRIRLEPTDDTSIWHTNVSILATGRYTVEIETSERQLGTSLYAFSPDRNRVAFDYEVTSNMIANLIIGALHVLPVLIFAGIALLAYPRLSKPVRIRMRAAQGTLRFYYLDENGNEVNIKEPINLTEFNRNNFNIPLNQIPVVEPPLLDAQVISEKEEGAIRLILNINGKDQTFNLSHGQKESLWEENRMDIKYFVKYEA